MADELTQGIRFVLSADGTDLPNRISADMAEVVRQQNAIKAAMQAGDGVLLDQIRELAQLSREHKALAGALKEVKEAEGEALRARIDNHSYTQRINEASKANHKEWVESHISDLKNLQDHLGRMNSRTADDLAAGVANPRVAQAIADATTQYNTEKELQDNLKALRDRSIADQKAASSANAASMRAGTQAMADVITAHRAHFDQEKDLQDALKALRDRNTQSEREAAAASAESRRSGTQAIADLITSTRKQAEETGRLRREFEATVLSVDKLADSAQKLKSDNIDAFFRNTAKLTREFESTVLSVDALSSSAQKIRSDAINNFYVNTNKLTRSLESGVISLDKLADSANKIRSDQINSFYENTAKLTKELEASVLSIDTLSLSAQKVRSDAINNFYVNTERLTRSLEEGVISLDKLTDSANKIKSDNINAFYVNTARLTKEFEASVLSVDMLSSSAQKIRSDAINNFYVNTQRLTESLEAGVISLDRLTDSANKIKSDQINSFYVNTAKLTKEFEATVLSVDMLSSSAQKLRSDQINDFYTNTAKMTAQLEAAVISVTALNDSAARLKSDRIDAFYRDTEKLTRQFEASVVSIDKLVNSAQSIKVDQMDALVTATERWRKVMIALQQDTSNLDVELKNLTPDEINRLSLSMEEMHAGMMKSFVSSEQLAESFKKAKSDEIDRVIKATERLRNTMMATGMSVADVNTKIAGMDDKQILALADSMQRVQGRTQNSAYAMLSFSHALQDLTQSGFGAIVNNIPLMTQHLAESNKAVGRLAESFGGPMGLAATMMFVGVGVDLLIRTAGPGIKQFGVEVATALGMIEDKTKHFSGTVEDAKIKVEALTAKRFKVDIDYATIRETNHQIKEMERQLSAYEAGKGDTAEKAMGAATAKAASDYLGGSEGIENAFREDDRARGIRRGDPRKLDQLERKLALFEKAIAEGDLSPATIMGAEGMRSAVAKAKNDYKTQTDAIYKAISGDFLGGSPAAVRQVRDLAQRRPEIWGREGLEGLTGNEVIANLPTSREDMQRRLINDKEFEDQERTDKEFEQQVARQKREAKEQAREAAADNGGNGIDADRQKKVREAYQEIKEGFFDQLVADLYEAKLQGLKLTDIQAQKRPDLTKRIAERGYLPEVAADTTEELIRQATIEALNAAESKQPPKLVKQEAAADRKDANDQNRDTKQIVGDMTPRVQEELTDAMLNRFRGGQDDRTIGAGLGPQVAARLKEEGVNPDVVNSIAALVIERVLNSTKDAMAKQGGDPRNAAQFLLQERAGRRAQRNEKVAEAGMAQQFAQQFQRAGGFNPQAAMQLGKQAANGVEQGMNPQAAMQQALRRMGLQGVQQQKVMLQIAANQEAMMGVVGEATNMLAGINLRVQNVRKNIGVAQQHMRRVRNMNPAIRGNQ